MRPEPFARYNRPIVDGPAQISPSILTGFGLKERLPVNRSFTAKSRSGTPAAKELQTIHPGSGIVPPGRESVD
jgi:hypothetical protein